LFSITSFSVAGRLSATIPLSAATDAGGGGIRLIKRFGRNERGQTLIEFALTLPFLLVLALLILDFGMAIDRREVLQNSIREAARAGSAGESVAVIKDTAVAESDGILVAGDVTVCYDDGPDSGTTVGGVDDSVVVKINHDYEMTALGSGILGAFSAIPTTTIEISPDAEGIVLKEVTGVTAC
jgi:hypothetical protein